MSEPGAVRSGAPTGGSPSVVHVETLFAQLSRRVYNVACWHTRDAAAADDIVSTVFEKVIRGLPRFDPSRASAEDWVFAVAMNALRDHARAARRNRTVSVESVAELTAAGRSPEDTVVERDRLARLLEGVAKLRPRDREVLTLRLAGGLSNEAVARLCRLRKGHVAVIVHRAVRELRVMLAAQEGP